MFLVAAYLSEKVMDFSVQNTWSLSPSSAFYHQYNFFMIYLTPWDLFTLFFINYFTPWKMLETETWIRYGPCFQKVHEARKEKNNRLF